MTKVNRGYQVNAAKYIMTDEDDLFHEYMVFWFYHFTNCIETQAQEEDSLAKLHLYIDQTDTEGVVSPGLLAFTRTFLRESFTEALPLLCFRHYKDIYCGDVNENCFTESDNSSLKRDHMGPSANANLCSSAASITKHTNRRMKSLKANSTKRFGQRLLPKKTDSRIESCRAELSKDIVDYKRDLIIDQFVSSYGE